MLMISATIYVLSLTTGETSKTALLKKRAKALGIEPPVVELPSGLARAKLFLTKTLSRPVHMMIVEPIVFYLSAYSAFTFGVLFAFLPAFPIVFNGVYHWSISQVGLSFLSLGIGYVLAVPTVIAFDIFKYQPQHIKAMKLNLRTEPEHRLYAAMLGSFGVTVGLFWFGWSAQQKCHPAVVLIGVLPFAWGNLCIFVSFGTVLKLGCAR
jgi:hypothetical protein